MMGVENYQSNLDDLISAGFSIPDATRKIFKRVFQWITIYLHIGRMLLYIYYYRQLRRDTTLQEPFVLFFFLVFGRSGRWGRGSRSCGCCSCSSWGACACAGAWAWAGGFWFSNCVFRNKTVFNHESASNPANLNRM